MPSGASHGPSRAPSRRDLLGSWRAFDISTTNDSHQHRSMYSDVRPATSSSKLAAGSRAFLSKLASPLKSRARNVADFHIRPFEPHRQYSPGDEVKGIVVLTVVKAIRVTHLTLALHGFVRVLKSAAPPGETIISEPAVPIANSRRSQYTGNGHASLFNNEVTLCGEGRLEPGIYEFEFSEKLPARGLPTSIDFERGTISYLIRATLTRPTSIGPTTTCEQKITLIENVDIGPMRVPPPRVISLEPIAKRSRKQIRSQVRLEALAAEKESATVSARRAGDSPTGEENNRQNGRGDTVTSSVRSRSFASIDMRSEASEESGASTSSTGYIIGQTVEAQSDTRSEPPLTPPGPRKTIKAKIQLSKSGCLPGDSIPITISIQHTKQIKSMHGIIITLYRQGRIDSAPPLSMFTDITGKDLERLKHEEYYPRSKTGLGGLSLTSPASTGVFRKDLSQTLAPILIDPATLSTVVAASLRVPEDVFPTITGVPGEMISFKYYVEVVIDLGGKLSGQDRHLPRLGMVSFPSMTNPTGPVIGRDGGVAPTLAAWGGNIVNTDRIRREKSVVASLFEVVVGSTDSARQRGRNAISRQTTLTRVATTNTEHTSETAQYQAQQEQYHGEHSGQYESYGHDQDQRHWHPEENDSRYQYNQVPEDIPEEHSVPPYRTDDVPALQLPPEEGLSEKERVRLAEQRLLPSRPPNDAEPCSNGHAMQPSAPPDPDAEAPVYASHRVNGYAAGSSSSPRPLVESRTTTETNGSSSTVRPAEPAASQPPTDDKQELARRHLQAEASSPSDFPYDPTVGDGADSSTRHAPSAPGLDEDDLYGDGYENRAHSLPVPSERYDGLPEYQR